MRPLHDEAPASERDPQRVEVLARDGRAYILRPIRAEDAGPLQRAFRDMAPQDRHARTFSYLPELTDDMAAGFTRLDPGREICVIIEDPARPGEIQGGARFMGETDGTSGEFAVSLSADLKGLGLARQALAHVLEWARRHGYAQSWGSILASNVPMLGLARRLGFSLRRDPEDAQVMVATLELDGLGEPRVAGESSGVGQGPRH